MRGTDLSAKTVSQIAISKKDDDSDWQEQYQAAKYLGESEKGRPHCLVCPVNVNMVISDEVSILRLPELKR